MDVVSQSGVPGDPILVDRIVCELKSQGIFDNFRKECIADVDTKPAYQNLRQRVEGSVSGFLKTQTWSPEMNKNQVREMLRKNIYESGFLETGVERIVDQVVNPKINTVFLPKVTEVVYKFLGIAQPNSSVDVPQEEPPNEKPLNVITVENLLPNDLEAVSPESDKRDDKMDSPHTIEDCNMDEDESPPFELIGDNVITHEENSVDSHLSGFSGLISHDSNHSEKLHIEEQDSNSKSSELKVGKEVGSSAAVKDINKSESGDKMDVDANKFDSNDSNIDADMNKYDIDGKGRHEKENDKAESKRDDKKSKSDKHRSRNERKDDKRSSDKRDKYSSRDSKDKHRNDKDKHRTSSSKTSSSSRDKSRSSSSKSDHKSKDHSKERKDSKPRDDKDRKSSHTSSSSKHKKSSSSSRDKDKKDSKRHNSTKDDHYNHKHRSERRSTDRDSNDGSGLKSSSSSHSESNFSQNSSSNTQSSKVQENSNSNSNDSGGNSDSHEAMRPVILSVDGADEIVLPVMKMIKPKIASNIEEAKRLIKIRKQLKQIEEQSSKALDGIIQIEEEKQKIESGKMVDLKCKSGGLKTLKCVPSRVGYNTEYEKYILAEQEKILQEKRKYENNMRLLRESEEEYVTRDRKKVLKGFKRKFSEEWDDCVEHVTGDQDIKIVQKKRVLGVNKNKIASEEMRNNLKQNLLTLMNKSSILEEPQEKVEKPNISGSVATWNALESMMNKNISFESYYDSEVTEVTAVSEPSDDSLKDDSLDSMAESEKSVSGIEASPHKKYTNIRLDEKETEIISMCDEDDNSSETSFPEYKDTPENRQNTTTNDFDSKNDSPRKQQTDCLKYFQQVEEQENRGLLVVNNFIKSLQNEVKILESKVRSNVCNDMMSSTDADDYKENTLKRKISDSTQSVKRSKNNNISLSADEDKFSLPLSPSDSDKSIDKKIETHAGQMIRPRKYNSHTRYSSDDLYKPRPLFTRTSRTRTSKFE